LRIFAARTLDMPIILPFSNAARRFALIGAAWMAAWSGPALLAQSVTNTPSAVDGFNPNVNGAVNVMLLQPDNKIIIGGAFTQLQPEGTTTPVNRYNIARVTSGGAPDNFYPNINGQVYSLALQPNGSVIVGGSFTTINGVSRNNIARLNPDGTLDTAFNPNATGNFSSEVFAVALQPDGRIVIGGAFNWLQPNGAAARTARNHIARLNADGSLDTTFDPNASAAVLSLAVQPNGSIILSGAFTSLQPNGAATPTTRNHIARVASDGTLDGTFNPSSDLSISIVLLQPDGRILLGGNFTELSPNGGAAVVTPDFARINSDGTIDSSFIRPNPTDAVTAIALQPDGRILIGGRFVSLQPINNSSAQSGEQIVRLNPDGTIDDNFTLNVGINGDVDSIVVQTDGEVVLGGNFDQVNAPNAPSLCNNITRFDPNGLAEITWDPSRSGSILQVVSQPSTGDLIIGGSFSNIGGVTAQFLARITPAGVLDTTFNPQLNGTISRVATQPNGDLIIGGNFTTVGGLARNGFARLNADGTVDTQFDPDPNVIGSVLSIFVQTNGQIVVGGNFTEFQPDGATITTERHYMARLNADGTLDPNYDPEPNSQVSTIAGDSKGRMVIGGDFTGFQPGGATNVNANVVDISYAARVNTDGSIDQSFSPEPNSNVNSVVVQPDGNILLGGGFTVLGPNFGPETTEDYLCRVTSSGFVDTTFTATELNQSVTQVVLAPNGQIYISGNFTSATAANSYYGASSGNYFLRLNSNGGLDSGFGLSLNGPVENFLLNSDGTLFLAGDFSAINSTVAPHFVHITANGAFDQTYSLSSGSAAFSPTGALGESVIKALALEPGGQVLAGGYFPDGLGGGNSANIMRFNLNGSADLAYFPNANQAVNAIATLTSSTPLSTQLAGLIWLNSDGTPRQAFQFPSGFQITGNIDVVAVDPSYNYIYVGGGFLNTSNGAVGGNLIRFHYATGELDTTFNPNPLGQVKAIAPQANGQVVIGGDFTTIQPKGTSAPVARNFIARLNSDGTLDTSFDPNLNGECAAILIQSTGTILIGGNFTTLQPNGATTAIDDFYLAQLNSDGTVNAAFNPDPNTEVFAITEQSDGKILIGGNFTTLQPNGAHTSTFRNYIARINADGTLDTAFDPEANLPVASIVEQSNDEILVGGDFTSLSPGEGNDATAGSSTTATTVPRDYVARLNADGTVDPTFNPNANNDVNSIAISSDGASIYVGGAFTAFLASAQSVPTPRDFIARLTPTGAVDPNFDPFLNSDVGRILAMPDGSIIVTGDFTTSQPTGTMLAGGQFTNIGGIACNYLAELREDGTTNQLFLPNPNGPVNALAVQVNNQTVVAGSFTTLQPIGAASPVVRNNIARINVDGSLDDTFNPNANGPVTAAAIQGDGRILIGGTFTSVGGQAQGYLARLNADGSLDGTFAPNVNGAINAVAVQADGKVLIAGSFSSSGAGGTGYLARLNADGSVDTGFSPSVNGVVNGIVVQASGGFSGTGAALAPTYTLSNGTVSVVPGSAQIIICGSFTSVDGTTRNRLARLNSDGSIDPAFNPGADNTVYAMELQPDARLLVGGAFGSVGGVTRFRMARLAQASITTQVMGVSTDLSSVLWTLDGGPEYGQVQFQVSTDDNTWTALGQASRVGSTSDWLLTGLTTLPSNKIFYVRAVGVEPTTQFGSLGIVLFTSAFPAIAPVAAPSAPPSFGGAASASAVVNAPFAYAIPATNSPTTYAATGLPAGLTLNSTTGLISGTPTQTGSFTVDLTASNAAGPVSESLDLTVAAPSAAAPVPPASRLINVSARAVVTSTDPLIGGLVIAGGGPKSVLLRAVGPTLGTLGAPDPIPDPQLLLYNSSGQVMISAGSWGGNSALAGIFAELGAFPLAADSADAAVVTTLSTGAYTVNVAEGAAGVGGTALFEVYDADDNPLSLPQRIVNLSGRAGVTPSNLLIGGFYIDGSAPKTVLIRGDGPALAGLGVTDPLAAPVLQIFDGNGNLIAQNSAWGTPDTVSALYPAASASSVAAAAASCGAFALASGSNDTAVLLTLPPGGYTAQISTANGTSGTALFEVYELP
jgi:uncharacterized delta-60 repeat protein